MNDDRISRALHQQADTITLTPADPSGTMRRGSRRRTRRRVGLAGAVAVAGILATTVAVRDSGDQELQLGAAPSASASTYQWSVVTPKVGLGYGYGMAGGSTQTADGTVYSLSTSPGTAEIDRTSTPALYRSSDGAEWDQRTLPSGVRTYGLAGAGDTLYGVGTAPSGGIVLSSSHDGAGSWSNAASIPDDVQQLKARHPDQIMLSTPQVAARDASHVVVSVVAATNLDLTKLGHPEYPQGDYLWDWDATGVTVRRAPKSECAKADEANDPVEADSAVESCRAAGVADKEQAQSSDPVASFTYDELGVSGELRDHIGGKPYVYVTDDGSSFRRVDVPADALPASSGGGLLDLRPLATPDGFRLFAGGYDGTSSHAAVLRSSDGSTWTADGSFPGGVDDVGVVGGHVAASVWGDRGATIQVEGPNGWTAIDPARLVPVADGQEAYLSNVAFGPLGMAAVVGVAGKQEGVTHEYLVHSADGSAFQLLDIGQHVDSGGMVTGLVVTPDAIAARITAPNDGRTSTPPTQQVLVGTPQ